MATSKIMPFQSIPSSSLDAVTHLLKMYRSISRFRTGCAPVLVVVSICVCGIIRRNNFLGSCLVLRIIGYAPVRIVMQFDNRLLAWSSLSCACFMFYHHHFDRITSSSTSCSRTNLLFPFKNWSELTWPHHVQFMQLGDRLSLSLWKITSLPFTDSFFFVSHCIRVHCVKLIHTSLSGGIDILNFFEFVFCLHFHFFNVVVQCTRTCRCFCLFTVIQ